MKSVLELTLQQRRVLQKLVAEQLQLPPDSAALNSMLDEAPRKRKTEQSALFGNYLDSVPSVCVERCGSVPFFLYHCVAALSQFTHLEGIFRKAGSIQRQKELRSRVEQGIAVDIGDISLAYDVASLMKQFLRELPQPLFTDALVSLCMQCARTEQAVLLLTLLLPPTHISTLKFVCEFLKQVSERSELNKMSARNLALVFSPSLFPAEPLRLTASVSRESFESAHFRDQMLVLELLITNAHAIGQLPPDLAAALQNACAAADSCEDEHYSEPPDMKDMSSRKRKSRSSIHSLLTDISHGFAKLRRTSFGQSSKENEPKGDADSFAVSVKDSSLCSNAPLAETSNMNDSKMRRRSGSTTPRRFSVENFEGGGQVVRFRKSLDLPSSNDLQIDQSVAADVSTCSRTNGRASISAWHSVKSPIPLAALPNCRRYDASDVASIQVNNTSGSRRSLDASPVAHCAPSNDTALQLLATPKVKPQMANLDLLINKNANLCRPLLPSSDRKRICVTHDDRRPAVRVKLL